jgi:hypothetical protein
MDLALIYDWYYILYIFYYVTSMCVSRIIKIKNLSFIW